MTEKELTSTEQNQGAPENEVSSPKSEESLSFACDKGFKDILSWIVDAWKILMSNPLFHFKWFFCAFILSLIPVAGHLLCSFYLVGIYQVLKKSDYNQWSYYLS